MEKQIQDLIGKSRNALAQLEKFDQEQIDAMCKAMCLDFKAHAEELSREVVDETGLGKYEHKVVKNTYFPDGIWMALKGKKSVGIIDREPEKGMVQIAHPKGVVVIVAPTTNPNITALCNVTYALKGRNTSIVCAHPRAQKTTKSTIDILNAAIKRTGGPDNVAQIVENPSVDLTKALMGAVDVVVATGGSAMVKSAYSSGRPAYGVGSGNVQAIIDEDYDLHEAARTIVQSRAFDNGLLCTGEQAAIVPESKHAEAIKAFEAAHAFYTHDPVIAKKFRDFIFLDGKLNPDCIGQDALRLAELAGVNVPAGTEIIMLQGDSGKIGAADVFCGEKLCPAMVMLTYKDWDDALRIAKTNLLYFGAGHTVVVHSNHPAKVEQAGIFLPVSRIACNQPAYAIANAFLTNGFEPTTTVGCGSWGNNSISENFSYRHLINVSRISFPIPGIVPPTPQEMYGADWKE